MKNNYFLFLTLFSFLLIRGQIPPIQWQKCIGSTSIDRGRSVTATTDGGCIVVGNTNGVDGNSVDTHGGVDVLVVKLNSIGTIEWQHCYGGTNNEIANVILPTSDGGYIFGGNTNSNNGDVTNNTFAAAYNHNWIVKINSTGQIVWQKFLPISQISSEVKSIIQVGNDFVIAGNCYTGLGNFSYGDVYITKIDNSGNPLLTQPTIIGGNYHDYINSIKRNSDGSYILAGTTCSTDNGAYVGNYSSNHNIGPGFGTCDAWILKLNSALQFDWHKLVGGTSNEEFFDVQSTSDGGYIFAGNTDSIDGQVIGLHSGMDCWVVKTDAIGEIQWQKTFGGNGNESAYTMLKTNDTKYLIAGFSNSSDGDLLNCYHGSANFWVFMINSLGDSLWQSTYGGSNIDVAKSISKSNDGGYFVTGEAASNDNDVSGNHSLNYDYWVIKLFPETLSNTKIENANCIIYPNPAKKLLNLQLPNNGTIERITIQDSIGKNVLELNSNVPNIDVSVLPTGLYTIQIRANNTIYQSKFLKQ